MRLGSYFLHHTIHAVFFVLYVHISPVVCIGLQWLIPPTSCHGIGDELPVSVVELSILNSLIADHCTKI